MLNKKNSIEEHAPIIGDTHLTTVDCHLHVHPYRTLVKRTITYSVQWHSHADNSITFQYTLNNLPEEDIYTPRLSNDLIRVFLGIAV